MPRRVLAPGAHPSLSRVQIGARSRRSVKASYFRLSLTRYRVSASRPREEGRCGSRSELGTTNSEGVERCLRAHGAIVAVVTALALAVSVSGAAAWSNYFGPGTMYASAGSDIAVSGWKKLDQKPCRSAIELQLHLGYFTNESGFHYSTDNAGDKMFYWPAYGIQLPDLRLGLERDVLFCQPRDVPGRRLT